MHLTSLFGRTLRQAPAEATSVAEQLLWRAGILRTLNDGAPALLPLGSAALRRLATHLTAAMHAGGAQEVTLPTTTVEPWLKTIIALARRDIDSYRQLPQTIWSWRRRKRPARSRSTLLDLPVSATLSWAALALDAAQTQSLLTAARAQLGEALHQCGLGNIADALLATGATTLIVDSQAAPQATLDCPTCGWRAPLELAPLAPPPPYTGPTPAMSLVETPGTNTIAALAEYLGIPTAATAKALFFYDQRRQRLVFAVVRGDREASLTKLAAAIDAGDLVPASAEQIQACGATPGYASPVGLREVLVVADLSVCNGAPLVAGANRPGYHLRDVVYGRDWQATIVADIAQAAAGDACPRCGATRSEGRGAVIGAISEPQPTDLLVQDADGQNRSLHLAGIELDLEPLLHLAVEQHHDERGIVWPAAIAPVDAHLVTLGRGEAVAAAGQELAGELRAAGLAVLLDDRDERAGVKLNDADLIGAPWRVVVSEKLLAAGQVEVRRRTEAQATVIARAKVVAWLQGRDSA
ncbi:YbaK/EbsC family protein [uncultured Chloroflexus sp.]|uniref:proline--tRNA ligase n=1 Tax=uncultured Chloroflexus sp. TaxID=214040 RepID=UPI002604387D|nr:YbaK/EbsC family protein [uncultured Chloroflexus sp.]